LTAPLPVRTQLPQPRRIGLSCSITVPISRTPHSTRQISPTGRGLPPGAPVQTRTRLPPATVDQLPGRNIPTLTPHGPGITRRYRPGLPKSDVSVFSGQSLLMWCSRRNPRPRALVGALVGMPAHGHRPTATRCGHTGRAELPANDSPAVHPARDPTPVRRSTA
jgi:hypothetical protein